jgi:MFS family permease
MLPPRLFARRTFSASIATAFLMTGSITAAAFLIAQYFQLSLGHSPLATGVRLLPWTATPIVVAPLAGSLSDRVGARPLMVGGLLLQAVGLGWFAAVATDSAGYASLVAPLVVAGVGISMAIPTVTAAALGAVEPADLGKASGTTSTLQRFGGAFGVALVTAVFSAHGHLGTPAAYDAGFRPALAVAAGLSLIGSAAALWVGGRRRIVVAGPQLAVQAERA